MNKRSLIAILIVLAAASGVIAWYRANGRSVPLVEKPFTDDLLENREIIVRNQQPGESSQNDIVTFLLAGDIMLSRNVASAIEKARDTSLPFSGMKDILLSTDFNFANLESPFSGKSDITPSGSLVFNTPPENVRGLADYHFRILTLANNHALDQGAAGLAFTSKLLDEKGIKHVGTGATLEEAWKPEIIEAKGARIAFIGVSYASINDGGRATNNSVARLEDTERLRASIAAARSEADIVIVAMHAGTEYVASPNSSQIAFAHAAVDAGADMVVGAHPHWVQTIEEYRGRHIFFSLGNFVFDQEWSPRTKQGLAVIITVRNKKLDTAELVPVELERYCCARRANDTEAKTILDGIHATSTLLNLK